MEKDRLYIHIIIQRNIQGSAAGAGAGGEGSGAGAGGGGAGDGANMSTVPEAAAGIGVVVVASPISNPNKSTSGALNMKKMQALD